MAEVERLGLNWLTNELQRAGIETAYPERDKLVDLIAYPVSSDDRRYVPMQVFAASRQKFEANQKYGGITNLLLVYIWNLQSDDPEVAYAMSYQECVETAQKMGWTKTESWRRGNYFTSNPSKKLLALLEPFRMTPAKWQERIRGS